MEIILKCLSQEKFFNFQEYLKFGSFSELDSTAIELPYNNSNVKLMIILPNSRTGLSALEKNLNKTNFSDLSKRMRINDIDLIMPKFEIEFDVDLEKPLEKVTNDER